MENQKLVFFSEKWNRLDDNSFLSHLEFFAHMEKRPLSKSDREIMKQVRDWINPKQMVTEGKSFTPMPKFTLTDCYRRFELAELRYHTWEHIISYEGVEYNKVGNTIKFSDTAMVEICEMHSIGEAYLWEPEYKWNKLQIIFGPYSSREQGPSSRSPQIRLSAMLDELIADIDKEYASQEDEDNDSEAAKPWQPPIHPPDMMSTTKGKGKIIPYPGPGVMSPDFKVGRNAGKAKNGHSTSTAKRLFD